MKNEHVEVWLDHMLNIEDLLLAMVGRRDAMTQGRRLGTEYILPVNHLRLVIRTDQAYLDCLHSRTKDYVEETLNHKAEDTKQTEFEKLLHKKHLDLWDNIVSRKEDSLLKGCKTPVIGEIMVHLEEDFIQIDIFKNEDIRMKESMTVDLDCSLTNLVHLSCNIDQT